jgi:hypothetical protein
MTTSRTDTLLAILQEYFNPREDGWLWLATYRDDADGGIVNQVDGAYQDPTATAYGLARMSNEGGADRAFLALCRPGGRPYEVDRRLWRELRRLVSADVLIDMVVFDRRGTWSMRAEDAAAA